MTVIAARIYEDEIRFAGDQQITAGYRKKTSREMELGKIVSINGMTIGGSGTVSEAQWLLSFARNHAPVEATEIDVSLFMLEFTDWMKQKKSDFKSENHYLIAFRKKLFRVFDSLSVFTVPEFSAIGSGSDFAIAAMHLGKDPKTAAKVASELDVFCSGQIEEVFHRWQ